MQKIYVCSIIGDGTLGNEFRPNVSNHTMEWRMYDGRANPLVASGLCLVEAEVTTLQHANAVLDPDIEEITASNVREVMARRASANVRSIGDAKDFLVSNRGKDNSDFKRSPRGIK